MLYDDLIHFLQKTNKKYEVKPWNNKAGVAVVVYDNSEIWFYFNSIGQLLDIRSF